MFLAGSLFGQFAEAGAIIVGESGTAGGCTVATIQAAIARAKGFGGYNLILVTDDVTDGVWHENLVLEDIEDNNLSIEIVGGFNNCADLDATAFGKASIYGGSSEDPHPVLKITGNNLDVNVKLRNLWMEGGSRGGGSPAGGIYFDGHGRVELTSVQVAASFGEFARGIYVHGAGGEARLDLSGNVVVTDQPGAGIDVGGTSVVAIKGNGNAIKNNSGNGIIIDSPAFAEIGATGEVLDGNGLYGLYINADQSNSGRTTRLYSTDPANNLEIGGNGAGAIYLRSTTSPYRLCMKNVGIRSNGGRTIHAEGPQARLEMNSDCEYPVETDFTCGTCNRVSVNTGAMGEPLIAAVDGATITIDRMHIRDNIATSILSTNLGTATSTSSITLTNSIVERNTLDSSLFESLNGGIVDIWDSTIAQNGGGFPLSLVGINPGLLQVTNSIIDQPQALLELQGNPSAARLNRVMVSNRIGAHSSDELLDGPPAYQPGTFRLQTDALGVDYSPAGGGVDFDGSPRDVDTIGVGNYHGPRDIGAYESQATLADQIFADGFQAMPARDTSAGPAPIAM